MCEDGQTPVTAVPIPMTSLHHASPLGHLGHFDSVIPSKAGKPWTPTTATGVTLQPQMIVGGLKYPSTSLQRMKFFSEFAFVFWAGGKRSSA
jgi:hypothetical protein